MASDGDDHARSVGELRTLPQIKPCDFVVDQILGEGAFSDIIEVRFKAEGKGRSVRDSFPEMSSSSFALKCSRTSDIMSAEMMNEATMLSKLDHKNIIKVMGVSDLPPMILLELLECTLEDRLEFWREQKKGLASGSSLFGQRRRFSIEALNMSFVARTEATVKGIARGLEYLHSKNIILRDLKSDNIGYNSKGEVKIFDFGFAYQIEEAEYQGVVASLAGIPSRPKHSSVVSREDEMEQAGTSTTLFRAPKCVFATDIYSFGVVLWEIATLKKAFASKLRKNPKHAPVEALLQKVSTQGWKSATRKIPNDSYRNLVEECWNSSSDARPSLQSVCDSWLPKIYCESSQLGEPTPPSESRNSSTSSRRSYVLPKYIMRRFQRSASFKAEAKSKTNESEGRRPSYTSKFSSCSSLSVHSPTEDNHCDGTKNRLIVIDHGQNLLITE